MTSQELILPGENEPSGEDVAAANEVPKAALLSNFKKSLFASQYAEDSQNLIRADFEFLPTRDRAFAYPMICLEDFPTLPSQDQLDWFAEAFFSIRSSCALLSALPIENPLRDGTVPPLRLAVACLGAVHLRRPDSESRSLFLGGFMLWATMIETDNRESRSIDMLLAILLLAMYLVTTTDLHNRPNMVLLISGAGTIARRLRLHDPTQIQPSSGLREISAGGSLMCCFWLNDILNALHFESAVHSFSSRELWTKMPSGKYDFQDIYHTCVNPHEVNQLLPSDMTSPDDAILLLVAFLSDLLYFRRSFSMVLDDSSTPHLDQPVTGNPFVPLTPRSELNQLNYTLKSALNTWAQRFESFMPPEVTSFYYYCKLHLACPELLSLPRLAGYSVVSRTAVGVYRGRAISDVAVSTAWSVLDVAAQRSKNSGTQHLCPVWLPICVFHAALVVWAHQTIARSQIGRNHGSRMMLLAFKLELAEMPWPCCAEMVSTLDRLMIHSTIPGQCLY